MSLKTSYWDGANGFNTKMNEAFDAGVAFVVANLTTLTTSLEAAAASGKRSFVVTITTSDNPTFLRQQDFYSKAYLSGISAGLSAEDIYNYECIPILNLKDSSVVKIDFNFSF